MGNPALFVKQLWSDLSVSRRILFVLLPTLTIIFFIIAVILLDVGSDPTVRCYLPGCCTSYCPDDHTGLCAQYGCSQCVGYDVDREGAACFSYVSRGILMLTLGSFFLIFSVLLIGLTVYLVRKWDILLGIDVAADLQSKEQKADNSQPSPESPAT